MTWTYAELKAADPGGDDLEAASATLNTQTKSVAVDVLISDVEGYFLVNGITIAAEDWLTANGPGNATVALAVRSFMALIASPRLQVVRMTDPATNAAVVQMLGAMTSVAILSADQQSAVLAMAVATAPVWQPPITAGDIQTARAQP